MELYGNTEGNGLNSLIKDIKGLDKAGCLLIIGSGGKVKIYLNDNKIISIEESEIDMPMLRRKELINEIDEDELPKIVVEVIERTKKWHDLRYRFTTYVNKPLVYINNGADENEFPLEWSKYYQRLNGKDNRKIRMA